MNSEEVAQLRQKVKGQKAATSALSQLGLMASTTNQPKRLRSRSGPYDAVKPVREYSLEVRYVRALRHHVS